jgi:UDP-4-amino-4,6-dideoxy-N-acetyl-beta-L-altrosamine transaminase
MSCPPPLLPYGRHTVDEDDVAAVAEVLRSPWLTCGPVVERFERAFAAAVGARFAVACSSGTAGLHLACMALDLRPGEGVVVPAMTFVATANAARYLGAEVIFADVDPDTGLMGPEHLRAAIDRSLAAGVRPRVAIPVHLNGQPCDMAALRAVAAGRQVRMIEDACHALGSESLGNVPHHGDRRGLVGDCRDSEMAVFSCHPVKTIAMGEGGVVTTNDRTLCERLARLRGHGLVRDAGAFNNVELAFDEVGAVQPWYYELQELGFNYRASEIHCALGLSQLGKLQHFVAARQALIECYRQRLHPLAPLVRPLVPMSDGRIAWHLAVVLIDFERLGTSRSVVMRALRASGIATQVHYIPVPWQPYYRNRSAPVHLPGAEAYYRRCLSLPLFATMTEADVDRVVAALEALIR